MKKFRLLPSAELRMDEIYDYTFAKWGKAQADIYFAGLFACYDDIAKGQMFSRPIPADLGVEGFYARHGRHFIYWRPTPHGPIDIVTILHQSMNQAAYLSEDFA